MNIPLVLRSGSTHFDRDGELGVKSAERGILKEPPSALTSRTPVLDPSQDRIASADRSVPPQG
jgi:hypothetical protein